MQNNKKGNDIMTKEKTQSKLGSGMMSQVKNVTINKNSKQKQQSHNASRAGTADGRRHAFFSLRGHKAFATTACLEVKRKLRPSCEDRGRTEASAVLDQAGLSDFVWVARVRIKKDKACESC